MSGIRWVVVILVGLIARDAMAQATVQQPAFGVFSGGTTVSVPDSGRGYIGGVGRGGRSSSRYGIGPLRPTTSGIFNESAGMSVSARIHDFSELDRQALEAAENGGSVRKDGKLPQRAESAYRSLQNRSMNATARDTRSSAPAEQSVSTKDVDAEVATVARTYLERGRKAEAAGQKEVALVYFRLAEKRGSDEARDALTRLQRPTPKIAVERSGEQKRAR